MYENYLRIDSANYDYVVNYFEDNQIADREVWDRNLVISILGSKFRTEDEFRKIFPEVDLGALIKRLKEVVKIN